MGTPIKTVNDVASKGYDEEEAKRINGEIWYLSNYSVGYRLTYQRQGGNQGLTDHERKRDWHDHDRDFNRRDKEREYNRYVPPHDRSKGKESNSVDPKKFKNKDLLAKILMRVKGTKKIIYKLKGDFSQINQTVFSTPP